MVPAARATTRGECVSHASIPVPCGRREQSGPFTQETPGGASRALAPSPQSSWAGCQAGNIQSTE